MRSTPTRRPWIGALIVTLVATVAFAQTTKSKTEKSSSDQQVRAAHQQLLQAAMQGDKDAVANLVTDDLTWVGTNGQVMNKDQVLGMLPPPVRSVDIQKVIVEWKTAVVVGTGHMNDGTETRFMQEWINRDGQWKLDAHEGTRASTTQEGTSTGSAGTGNMENPPSSTGTSGAGGTMSPTTEPTFNSADERAVWQVQQKLGDAFLKGDTKTYARYTAPEYTRVTPNGVMGKTEFLRTVAKNAGQPSGQLQHSDVQITIEGNTARAVMIEGGTMPGGQQVPPSRVTRIFEKRNGQWQQVAAVFARINNER
jgi:ketosteroid isomerase-like protein